MIGGAMSGGGDEDDFVPQLTFPEIKLPKFNLLRKLWEDFRDSLKGIIDDLNKSEITNADEFFDIFMKDNRLFKIGAFIIFMSILLYFIKLLANAVISLLREMK